ncbi:MAG: carbamoyltransferase HypF [Desulfobacterales bacterium]
MNSLPRSVEIQVQGIVQGVGFRPFVYQLAHRMNLKGDVANTSAGVLIRIQGEPDTVESFVTALEAEAPPLSRITEVKVAPSAPGAFTAFIIRHSRSDESRSALISPDVSVCADCLKELFDPGDRRHRYPFINCTNCGPRYTIINDIPYDRPKTSMARFTMCGRCQREYDDPMNRRFHAQPNACPDCGPKVSLLDARGRPVPVADPIAQAISLLSTGHVVAIKGLGGFHLAADAENPDAVGALRRRKCREEKPFALMVRSLERIDPIAWVSDAEAGLLTSAQRPIVLLEKRQPNRISPDVAPGNRCFGVMLPYTPLHYLLMEGPFPALVMTSGNLSEEPIAIDNLEAVHRLQGIADYFLVHDRDIYLRSDDSILRQVAGHPRQIRRSRGYVPVPVFLKHRLPQVMALGAELKNTVCLLKEDRAFMGQHVGDLENMATFGFFQEILRHLKRILDIEPELIACDRHPDYLSTRFALEQTDLPVARIQHHHAHIVSCMAENRIGGPVIGLSFDGSGYGDDGTVWGGEVIVSDESGFERVGHLGQVGMPGSAAAIREPWRMAVAYLHAVLGANFWKPNLTFLQTIEPTRIEAMLKLTSTGINTPMTSSVGRLFDAVAAMTGLRNRVAYEGQAAMELEMAAADEPAGTYEWEWTGEPVQRLRFEPLVRGILSDLEKSQPVRIISRRFHDTLVEAFRDACRRIGRERGITRVALSGGVFQNALLLKGMIHGLERDGFGVYSHRLVPANDGGISLGQAVAAARMMG